MKINKKLERGFTLVELLAVIVILAIVLAISVPGISGIVKSATKASFESDAKMTLKQFEYEKLENDSFDVTTVTASNLNIFNLSNVNYENLTVAIVDDKPYILIVGKDKWDGLKACGTIQNMNIVAISDTVTCTDISNASISVNKPKLAAGMTPIKWNGSSWVDTTESDDDWYSYTTVDKKWANARTTDGSMWVWIPRYIYKISSGWHSNTAGVIDIQFSVETDDTIGGTVTLVNNGNANDSNGTWTNHPAFTFGNIELTGIWVAKFEASGTAIAIDFKPNVVSFVNLSMTDTFLMSRNLETNNRYGWGTSGVGIDTHLMKNVEWGAVTYLSQSLHGKNDEIWINNSSTYTTGCAGNSVSAASYSGCQNAYNTVNGQQASTTGNIYGIYDMAGGTYEYTAAYVDNGNENLNTYGDSIIYSNPRYSDIYSVTTDAAADNYDNTSYLKGDAVYETSNSYTGVKSWYGDGSYIPYNDNPWFGRGGYSGDGVNSGVFYFNSYNGDIGDYIGFRSILAVGTGF